MLPGETESTGFLFSGAAISAAISLLALSIAGSSTADKEHAPSDNSCIEDVSQSGRAAGAAMLGPNALLESTEEAAVTATIAAHIPDAPLPTCGSTTAELQQSLPAAATEEDPITQRGVRRLTAAGDAGKDGGDGAAVEAEAEAGNGALDAALVADIGKARPDDIDAPSQGTEVVAVTPDPTILGGVTMTVPRDNGIVTTESSDIPSLPLHPPAASVHRRRALTVPLTAAAPLRTTSLRQREGPDAPPSCAELGLKISRLVQRMEQHSSDFRLSGQHVGDTVQVGGGSESGGGTSFSRVSTDTVELVEGDTTRVDPAAVPEYRDIEAKLAEFSARHPRLRMMLEGAAAED